MGALALAALDGPAEAVGRKTDMVKKQKEGGDAVGNNATATKSLAKEIWTQRALLDRDRHRKNQAAGAEIRRGHCSSNKLYVN
jgi:hypothetical protein